MANFYDFIISVVSDKAFLVKFPFYQIVPFEQPDPELLQ